MILTRILSMKLQTTKVGCDNSFFGGAFCVFFCEFLSVNFDRAKILQHGRDETVGVKKNLKLYVYRLF